MNIKVDFYEIGQIADDKLLFAVIASRYNSKWVFCRHKERDTYEIPGGRRETGESIDETAKRELVEETGALDFDIMPVCIYSVVRDGSEPSYGKLYFSKIHTLGVLPQFEIAQACLFDSLPDKLTYPQIQPHLHHKIQVWLSIQSGKGELWDVYDKNRNKTGRIHERGIPLPEGDYHLVVYAWIQNSDGRFLVMQRAETKGFPFMWESVGGSALAGETSIDAVLREIKEETGLILSAESGRCLFTQTRIDYINDVWLFKADFNFDSVKLQENETVAAKLVTLSKIEEMLSNGAFVPCSYFQIFKNMTSEKKEQNRLYLKVPAIDELDYRIKLLADPETMEYNKGYGDDDTGCYYLTKEKAERWYNYWTSDPKRYYAYIMKTDGDIPIGDVNIHFDKDYNLNMIGIVIEAKHRGKGYSQEALRLLADVAFYQIGLDAIFDCLPHDRPIAEKVFVKVGFTWTDNDILLLTKERYESINNQKEKSFLYDVLNLGLSQMYISNKKLDEVYKWFSGGLDSFKPILVRDFSGNGKLTITDGHTRAFTAWKAGIKQVPILIDNGDIYNQEDTIKEYLMCIDWCNRFGLKNIADLNNRTLSEKDFIMLWDLRCDRMQHLIAALINGKISEQAVKSIQNEIEQQGLLIYGVSGDLQIFYCDDQHGKSFVYQQGTLIEK